MPYRLFPRRLRERIGRRGLALLLFGIAWIVQGSAYFLLHDLIAASPDYFLIDRLPLWLQGVAWIASGLLSIRAGVKHRSEDDTSGFVSVTFMPMATTASAAVGTFTYALAGSTLWVLGALTVLVWLPMIGALSLIASWPEAPVRDQP